MIWRRLKKCCENKGARFACEPTVLEGLGIRYFHIFDNDGNLIEFGQSLNKSPPHNEFMHSILPMVQPASDDS